jgi:hypothetical protein
MLRYDDKGMKSELWFNGHVKNQYAYALRYMLIVSLIHVMGHVFEWTLETSLGWAQWKK